MKPLDRVLYIAGVARSGTSWLGQIFAAHPQTRYRFQPLFSYEFKDRVDEDSSRAEFDGLFRDIFASSGEFLEQREKQASGEYPVTAEDPRADVLVVKENRYQSVLAPMLRRTTDVGVVGIVRHPCAVLNSWRKNDKEFPPGSDFATEWRHGMCKNSGPQDYFGYFRWKEVANLYLDLASQHPDRFTLVRYEDLVRSPVEESRRLLAFGQLDVVPEVEAFLADSTTSHDDSYYSVFKDPIVAHRWRQEMPTDVVEEIEADLAGTRLEFFVRDER